MESLLLIQQKVVTMKSLTWIWIKNKRVQIGVIKIYSLLILQLQVENGLFTPQLHIVNGVFGMILKMNVDLAM
jgi:hypothetical protein